VTVTTHAHRQKVYIFRPQHVWIYNTATGPSFFAKLERTLGTGAVFTNPELYEKWKCNYVKWI